EPGTFLRDVVAKRPQFARHFFQRPGALVDSSKLGLELGAERTDQGAAVWPASAVKHLIRCIEDCPKQLQLLAQNLERERLSLIVPSEKVDDGDVVLLAIAVTAADSLRDALRVPRQVVVHDRVAELQVEALSACLGRDEHPRPSLELMHQR